MREKIKRNDLQSEDKEFPEKAAVATQEPRVMSFDVYFSKQLAQDPTVFKHHKAPMKQFAEARGLKDATEEQFDEIFRSY